MRHPKYPRSPKRAYEDSNRIHGRIGPVMDIYGSREIIENEVNGLIVPSKNSTELYKAMERMFVDKESYAKMVEAARPMIASRFDKNFVQKCLIDFYEEVLTAAK